MLMMVEKGIRGGICQAVYRHAKANNKYMNNYDKNIDSSYLEYLDQNNLYGWAMSQNLLVDSFEWVQENNLLKFNESFIKNYDENCNKGYILEVDVKYPKIFISCLVTCHFHQKEKKMRKCNELVCTIQNRKNCYSHKCIKTSIKSWINTKKIT